MKERDNDAARKKPLVKRFKPRPGTYNSGVKRPTPKRNAKGHFSTMMITNPHDKEVESVEFLTSEDLRNKGLIPIGSTGVAENQKTVFALDGFSESSASISRKKGPGSDTSTSVRDIIDLPAPRPSVGTSSNPKDGYFYTVGQENKFVFAWPRWVKTSDDIKGCLRSDCHYHEIGVTAACIRCSNVSVPVHKTDSPELDGVTATKVCGWYGTCNNPDCKDRTDSLSFKQALQLTKLRKHILTKELAQDCQVGDDYIEITPNTFSGSEHDSFEHRSSGAQSIPAPEHRSEGFVTPELVSTSTDPVSSSEGPISEPQNSKFSEPKRKTKRTADTSLQATDLTKTMTDESTSVNDESGTVLLDEYMKKRNHTPEQVFGLFFKASKDLPLTEEEEQDFDEYSGFEEVVQWYAREVECRAQKDVQARAAELSRLLEQEEAAKEKDELQKRIDRTARKALVKQTTEESQARASTVLSGHPHGPS